MSGINKNNGQDKNSEVAGSVKRFFEEAESRKSRERTGYYCQQRDIMRKETAK